MADTTKGTLMSIELSAMFGINRDFEDKYETDPWYDVLGLGDLGWVQLGYALWSDVFGEALGSPATTLIPTDGQYGETVQNVFEVRHTVRLAKNGKNFKVFLPVYHGRMDPSLFFTGANSWYAQDAKAIADRIEAVLPNVTDAEQSLDLRVQIPTRVKALSSEDLGFPDADATEKLWSTIKSVRLISPPCTKALTTFVSQNVIDAWGQNIADSYMAKQFVGGLLRSRLVTLYVELEVSNGAARHICQGEPRLSLLGEYFIKAMESEHLFGASNWVHNVVPISAIAKANAASDLPPVARTDENGLTVDGKGNLLWIPSVDNSEFVEEEMEQGGMQPDGEWSRSDMVNPEQNEYIVAPGANGRNVRQRKPKGRNKLIYTDWHNARLSYTDDNGSLDLLDLSMYRKAGIGQLAKLLKQRLNDSGNRESATNLRFAVERGAEMGARVADQPALYEPFFSAEEASAMTDLLNSGKLFDYVNAATQRLERIVRTGEGSRRWTAEEIQAFDPIWENDWLSLDLIHANSPITFLRQLADMLRQSYDLVMGNQDQVFGRYVVTTTLKEMATLLVVVNYAGQRATLASKDLEERAKYVTPDLAPADQIEVTDIPFVSGKVELFPHQVKAWNYLKNTPQNVVLDVAAGGGKTLLALLDIAYQLGKGMRLPLIACPENLIKNYINDALWLFDGKMNMVVINGTTFNSPEWGEEKLLELVRHAPPNTIFLTDYNFIIPRKNSKRVQEVMYGTESITVSLNTEFLKKIPWGGIWMDESHMTKNAHGQTNKELMRLTATIPYKRQLSGTYISDNLTDVVGQFGLMSPQTFGDMEDFLEEYFEEGTRNSAPIPGAQRKIRQAMSEEANVITIRRKEWAALLPRRNDNFWAVEMSPAQKAVYISILQEQRQLLEEEYEGEEEQTVVDEEGNVIEDVEVDDNEINESDLVFYLQRLERFITAPASDPYVIANPSLLTGSDLVSPKLPKLVQVIKDHKAKRIPGKILVWTQYVESAASLFRNLPEDIRSRAILYTAGTAESAMSEFMSNPNKDVMFGCEKSMNTGHNLQFCSRIIRMETVWNWGTLEQGEARINRPSKNDPRREENGGQGIFYDWIFCNKSMDVTKNARMISKLISTVKFYEQNNPAYQDLTPLETIRLSKDNIFSMNDWEQENGGCLAYFNVYAEYAQLEQKEFDDFINNPENRIEPYTLEEGEILEGSGLLKRLPYIPQMQLYASDKLGLVPFVQYISSTMGTGKNKKTLLADDPDWSPAGMKVHTEYGDCVVKGYNLGRLDKATGVRAKPKSMRVVTPNGNTVTVLLTMAWVITKETTSGEDVRISIARKAGVDVGQEVVPTKIKNLKQLKQTEVVEDVDSGEPAKGRKPADNDAPGFGVFLETYNHQLSLVVNTEDADAAAALPTLKKLGFVEMPDYNYSKVANWKVLRQWVDNVSKKAEIHPDYLERLEEDIENWKAGKTMERFAYGLASAQRKNFLLAQKTSLPKGVIKPYLVAHNHKIFLCMNVKVNQATWPKVKAASTTGVSWKTVTGEHWCFLPTKQAAQQAVKELFAKFNIINRKELVQQFAEIRVIKTVSK
jgi:hypothetical protein